MLALLFLAFSVVGAQAESGASTARAIQAPAQNIVTSNILELITIPRSSTTSTQVAGLAKRAEDDNGTEAYLSTVQGRIYLASVTFGGTPYTVVVDTGSSDTWLAKTGFECVSPTTGTSVPEAQCAFGPLYTPSPTLIEIPGLEFNISYADNETLSGTLGYELATIAGLSIQQMVGIVDTAAWYGDGQSSGLLGLGYPTIDSAHDNQNISGYSFPTTLNYTPFFATL